MSDLVKQFEDYLPTQIEEAGFERPLLLASHHDGQITMAVMAIPGDQIFHHACHHFLTDLTVKELIFCVDQYTKPNQGTKYDDALIVFWWAGEYTEDYGFRFGVINYRPPPNLLIEPIDWNNAYWTEKMREIVQHDFEHKERLMERIRKTHPDIVASIEQFVINTKALELRSETNTTPECPSLAACSAAGVCLVEVETGQACADPIGG
jgi:hypothetical protein